MKNFKLIRGYGPEDYIEINEDELEKALYCFLEKKDGVFTGGAIRGSQILAIQPDYHKAMGWNRGHKLEALDYAELSEKGIDRAHTHLLSTTKEKVQYLMGSNQIGLIGKNVEVEGYTTKPQIKSGGGMKHISNL